MKKIVTLGCLLFLISHAFAQQHPEFAPLGAYFKYRWASGIGGGIAQDQVVGDTLINQLLFKKIAHTYQNNAPQPPWELPVKPSYRYLRLQNNIVYEGVVEPNSSNIQLIPLYDFQAQVGDSIVRYETMPSTTYHVWKVDSIANRDIGGRIRRVVYYQRYCQSVQRRLNSWRVAAVVEGIGILNEGWFWIFSYNCGLSGAATYELTCYNAPPFSYPANANCSEFRLDAASVTDSEVSIRPNPVSEVLTIQVPMHQVLQRIELTNLLGQKKGFDAQTTISVANIPSGTYFLTLHFHQTQITKTITIQH